MEVSVWESRKHKEKVAYGEEYKGQYCWCKGWGDGRQGWLVVGGQIMKVSVLGHIQRLDYIINM